jgi:preprotein translocase subunit SecB
MAENEEVANPDNDDIRVLRTQKIYLKDVSFESPNSPGIFTDEWRPKLGIEIEDDAAMIADDTYHVVLKITATVTVDEKTAFLAEVQQAGIFTIKGFKEEILHRRLNVYCPYTLYPYACAALDDLVVKGGFPPLLLPPYQFARQYDQQLQKAREGADESASVQH